MSMHNTTGAGPDDYSPGSLTRWEVEGLVALLGALQAWGGGRTRRGGVSAAPASIASPASEPCTALQVAVSVMHTGRKVSRHIHWPG